MRRQLPPEVKLFAHYSIPRPETYAKIGGFVCGTPLHVTFAGIMTRQPDEVLALLQSLLAKPIELPHMEYDQMKLAHSYYHIKPIVTLHDTALRLTELQDTVLDAIAPLTHTNITARTRYADGRSPHVTIDRIFCEAQMPKAFDIDHLMVTTGIKLGPGHWHNDVLDIIYLNDITQSIDGDANAVAA